MKEFNKPPIILTRREGMIVNHFAARLLDPMDSPQHAIGELVLLAMGDFLAGELDTKTKAALLGRL